MAASAGTPIVAGSPEDRLVRPLSAEDLSILALESETVAGHTCKVIVLADGVEPELLRASIASRLDGAPELCLRMREIDGVACWVSDGHVDLDMHVVGYESEGPLDEIGLREAVARTFEQRLDRHGPMWRIDVVPELEGGKSALIWRIHHALADGATSMRIARAVLWDEEQAPGGGTESPSRRPAAPGRPSAAAPHHRIPALGALTREVPRPWRRSPFDGHIDGKRAVAFASVDLDGLHRVAAATDGATVNDAVLTVVAGGLRRWLEARHGHLGAIRVKVPVSLHGVDVVHHDEASQAGNRDSFFCLDLPLTPEDPLVRLAQIRRATRVRKRDHDAERLDALMRELGGASPLLRRFAERALAHPRSFALNVSNVPGPRRPVHVLGVPVRGLYSMAEIRQRHALRVSVTSLAGMLDFGLCADPTLLPDVDRLAQDIEAEAGVLLAHRPLGRASPAAGSSKPGRGVEQDQPLG
jgi:diacylglycerol O-acyltransferase